MERGEEADKAVEEENNFVLKQKESEGDSGLGENGGSGEEE